MPERETTTITTPGGHSVILKSYLTGREAQELKAIIFSAVKMGTADTQVGRIDLGSLSGDLLIAQEKRTMELVLMSLDGSTENVLERLLDLPSGEYDAVKAEVDKITNPTTPGKSAQLGSGTSAPAA